eukprot:Em0003g1083a
MEASLAKVFWASLPSSHKIPLPKEHIPTPAPDTLSQWKSAFGTLLFTLNEVSIHERAAALAAETRKHAANDARCQALGWSCIPLAVETFGNWGREAQCVFSRLATLLTLRQHRPKSSVVKDIYGCLSISLHDEVWG